MMTLQERVHKAKPKESWPLNKLHHVLAVRGNNKNIGMINDNLLSLSYGRIVNKNIDSAEGLLPESFETYQIVQPGDIVMRLTDLQNDKRSIRQGLVKEQGIITSAYDAVYPKKGHEPRFWAYALLALDLAKYYYSLGGGVRQSIKFKDFPNDWIYTPPTEAQNEIADFLDRETARIDQLIEKKERLLSLLQEKGKSLAIDILLGKNVDEPRKEWLHHTIPESWKVSKFSRHFISRMGETILKEDLDDNGVIPVFSATEKDTVFGFVNDVKSLLKSGDLIIPARGNCIGAVKIATTDCTSTQTTIQSRCIDHKIEKKFAYFWLKNFRSDYFHFERTAIPQITVEQIGANLLVLPPIGFQLKCKEELEILEYKNNAVHESTSKSIILLHEFRTSLITEAVTGQLDIKVWKKKGGTDKRLDNIAEAMAS